ncbi:hypothetical protein [Hydrogenophaga sp. MI9]|uniref:hypothetical protein n=1 Tax=Hydrogenophaga sp. MI9 TaxID=3453719 RepID=UPI003EEB906A
MSTSDDQFAAFLATMGRSGRLRQRDSNPLSQNEKRKIAQYLENPVSSGLWHLNAVWLPSNGISADIWADIEKETKDKETLTIRSGKRDRRIKINDEWRMKLRQEVCSTLTFTVALFDYLVRLDTQQPESIDQFGPGHEEVQLVLDLIDIGPIKEKYVDALNVFRQTVWLPGFDPVAAVGHQTRLKSGSMIVQRGPRSHGELSAIAWDSSPLHDLQRFLLATGKIEEASVMPVFSPEEEVFAPYFDLLRMAYDFVIPQPHLQPVIEKAMTNFAESNFSDCVSAIGLASEDVLTQIFETLYREQLTKGLTLGQLADELHARAAALFKRKEEPLPDVAVMYPELKAAIEDPQLSPAKSVELLRRLVTLMVEVHKHTNVRIDRFGKPERKILIWPEIVNNAVNELIRYRNAASHKSRIPIGPMECRRAAFSFVVLIRWWLKERTLIDWNKSPLEILKSRVDLYSKS